MRDKERLRDTQEMSDAELTVYEAAAALNVAERPATVEAITRFAGLPEGAVRRCLGLLASDGRLVLREGAYRLGPHDWGVGLS